MSSPLAKQKSYMTSCRGNSELPLSSSSWSNEHNIRHYHHSVEYFPGSSSTLDEVQFQTIHNRPPNKPVKRQFGYHQRPQVACNSTLETKKAKISCWRTAKTTSHCCASTTVRGTRLFPRMTFVTIS